MDIADWVRGFAARRVKAFGSEGAVGTRYEEAADEIERLRAALAPFSEALTAAEKEEPTEPEARLLDCFHRLTLYEFGKARQALNPHGQSGPTPSE